MCVCIGFTVCLCVCVCVCLCETFGRPHQFDFVESAELQEISRDVERQIYTLSPERALQPRTQQSNGRAQGSKRRRAGRQGREGEKEEKERDRGSREQRGLKYCRGGGVLSMECNMAAVFSLPSCSCTLCFSLSIYPSCSSAHTSTHARAHTHKEAVNLPASAAGIETPKKGLCCVWRECRCTCLQHIILCPCSSPSLSLPPSPSSSPPVLFYPLDLSSEFSVSCS